MGKDEAEIDAMKVKDLFETTPLLTGRTEIDTVSKLNVGLILSVPGSSFLTQTDALTVDRSNNPGTIEAGETITFFAPVNLPHGATVTSVKGYGSIADETVSLIRVPTTGSTNDTLSAATNFGTEQTTITNATIDNLNFCYTLFTSSLDVGDDIFFVVIQYTV